MIELADATPDEDVQLLRDAAGGDWNSIAALYDRHRDGALAVATSVLADPVEAEDVVHDVFIDLPRMARTYDPRRGRPEQWLCRSVRNRAIDHVRRRSRRQSRVAPSMDGSESLLALVPSRAASPTEIAEADEFLELLGRLDARHAHLVRLAFVDGWSHSAIARITGMPLGTVKTRLRNSVRQIGDMLGDPAPAVGHAPGVRRATPMGRLVVISTDDGFVAEVLRGAAGLARVEVLSWDRAAMESTARDVLAPAAIVVDLATAETDASDAIDRLAGHHWDGVALLVRAGVDGVPQAPRRRGATLVVAPDDAFSLEPATAVRAVLTASGDRIIGARAITRLMRSGGAFVIGDRLGRIRSATPAASRLLGRSERQLEGTYVTDLSASGVADAERQWQGLAGQGRWTGTSVVRRPVGPPVPIAAAAWMVPDGFIAALAPADLSSEGVA